MKILITVVFLVYLIILIQLILFKGSFFFHVVPADEHYKEESSRSTLTEHNFVPFRTIKLYLNEKQRKDVKFFNLYGNVLLFLPFGFLLPLVIQPAVRFGFMLPAIVLLSTSFELYQLFTRTGECDVDDVILNTIGGLIGYLFFFVLYKANVFKSILKTS